VINTNGGELIRVLKTLFNLLGSHAHSFQDYVCLELRFLTILELKLVKVFMMVDSHDWVVNTWHCWENVFLGVGRW
jgi:hypothetical protein